MHSRHRCLYCFVVLFRSREFLRHCLPVFCSHVTLLLPRPQRPRVRWYFPHVKDEGTPGSCFRSMTPRLDRHAKTRTEQPKKSSHDKTLDPFRVTRVIFMPRSLALSPPSSLQPAYAHPGGRHGELHCLKSLQKTCTDFLQSTMARRWGAATHAPLKRTRRTLSLIPPSPPLRPVPTLPRKSDSDLVFTSGRAPPPVRNQIRVLHACENYIVIDKDYDQRIYGDFEHTVEKLLAAQCSHGAAARPCHRLDYATSGCMLWALNKKAAGKAGKAFARRHVQKLYLALIDGHLPGALFRAPLDPRCPENLAPPQLCLDWPIAADESDGFRMRVGRSETDGRAALTNVWVLAHGRFRGRKASKVLCPRVCLPVLLRAMTRTLESRLFPSFPPCCNA